MDVERLEDLGRWDARKQDLKVKGLVIPTVSGIFSVLCSPIAVQQQIYKAWVTIPEKFHRSWFSE